MKIAKGEKHMTELEKLEAGLEYSFWDKEVNARKQHAMIEAAKLNAIDPADEDAIAEQLHKLFGSCGDDPWTGPGSVSYTHLFECGDGLSGALRGSVTARQHRYHERLSLEHPAGSHLYSPLGTEHGCVRCGARNLSLIHI